MKRLKIVVALGGNALGTTLPEQAEKVKVTAKAIADLVEEGHDVVLTHGNGPQVGIINNAMRALAKEDTSHSEWPLSVCGAMSQAYIGYDLQNALREELNRRRIDKPIVTLITEVEVDKDDPAFMNPVKPIGKFMSEEDAKIAAEKYGYVMKEDSGRGYRRVVPSPMPIGIVELDAINAVIKENGLVICCGGGGIPVVKEGDFHYKGVGAVIDKDFASELLAEQIDADFLVMLTAVEKVCIHFGEPKQKELSELDVYGAKALASQGQFGKGSMLPKVMAGVKFAESKKGRRALITLLEKAIDGINGLTGTIIQA